MNKVHWYFTGERNESLVFLVIGLVAMACSFWFWLGINTKFYNGLGWPLFFIAIVQLMVGTMIFLRSPYDEKKVTDFYANSPKSIKNIEIPRMEKVMKSFVIYRYVEITLILIGLSLFLYTNPEGFWRGIALGIVIQAGLMLIADHFAEKRGKEYLQYIKESVH